MNDDPQITWRKANGKCLSVGRGLFCALDAGHDGPHYAINPFYSAHLLTMGCAAEMSWQWPKVESTGTGNVNG